MRYCDKCNVGVHKDLVACPLCGKAVEDCRENYFQRYTEEIQPRVKCAAAMPVPSKEKFWARLFFSFMLLIWVIAIVTNLLYPPAISFAHFIIFGTLLLYIDVFQPVAEGKRLNSRIILNVIIMAVFIMTIDLLQPGGWKAFTFTLGFPIIGLASLAVTDFMIVFRRKTVKEYFVNLYFVTAFSIVPQIVVWANLSEGQYSYHTMATVAFFTALINAIIVTILLFPWIKEEFQRKFFIDN
jgi:hypothetical protein